MTPQTEKKAQAQAPQVGAVERGFTVFDYFIESGDPKQAGLYYHVSLHADDQHCTCPAYKFRPSPQAPYYCKHMHAANEVYLRDRAEIARKAASAAKRPASMAALQEAFGGPVLTPVCDSVSNFGAW
jgi:hypothetical protein